MAENRSPVKSHILPILLLSVFFSCHGQVRDSLDINKSRLRTFTISGAVAYGATLYSLHQVWYKNNENQSFRFFNDNAEWKQVDKLGHFYSAFYFSYGTARALQWCNVKENKSDLAGALTGFLVLLPIEVFDGFSAAYGASSGDLIANAAGASFYLGQKYLWKEIRIYPKFSAHSTSHAQLRPELLGDNTISEIIKNYNGQTYWLSADMDKFIPFPKWLNLSFGYGAQDMIYARNGQNISAGFDPYRQYYFSVDFDFNSIRTRSKALRTVFFILNTIKLPAPTLEISRRRTTFHALYF